MTRCGDSAIFVARENSANVLKPTSCAAWWPTALRHEAAQLVGFKTFAEFSLATKMAESPQRVIEFLRDLARRSRAVARNELAMITTAGRKLESWDVAFYAERLRQQKLGLAEEELRLLRAAGASSTAC